MLQRTVLAPGQFQAVCERKIRIGPLEMRREFRQLAIEGQSSGAAIPFESVAVAPSREPLKEFASAQQLGPAVHAASAVNLRQPLNELPVVAGEKFLFVSGARGQLDDFSERSVLFACAGAKDNKLNHQAAQIGLVNQRTRFAHNPQSGARRIQVRGGRGQQPILQLLDQFLLPLGLLEFGEARKIRMRRQFGRQRTIGPEEEQRGFLQPGGSLRREQPRPPFLADKIFPREGQPFQIILEQQPGALRVDTVGEILQPFRAFRYRRFGIREFPPEVGKHPVGLVQHDVVGIVFGGGQRTRSVSVFA